MTIAYPRLGSLLAIIGLFVMACEETPGEGVDGDPCTANSDCASMLCVAGIDGPEGVCTHTCGANTDCPEGWSCGAVTEGNVVVCRHGASTPFGQ